MDKKGWVDGWMDRYIDRQIVVKPRLRKFLMTICG